MHLRGYCIVSKFLVGGSNQCAFRISVVHDRKEKKYTFNNRDEQYNRIRLFRTKASLQKSLASENIRYFRRGHSRAITTCPFYAIECMKIRNSAQIPRRSYFLTSFDKITVNCDSAGAGIKQPRAFLRTGLSERIFLSMETSFASIPARLKINFQILKPLINRAFAWKTTKAFLKLSTKYTNGITGQHTRSQE